MSASAPAASISVAIVEDERDVREGLATLIGGAAGFRCQQTYPTMEEALERLPRDPPDVLLSDLRLPGMSGSDGIERLRQELPELPILVLTVHDNDEEVWTALCRGASGYLLKNTPPQRLLESLREAAAGGAPMSPEIARRVVRLFQRFRRSPSADYHLTPQENELLRLIADGHHKKTAAAAMQISINTVSFHLKNIYLKLHVHSKTEAVTKALREGLV